MRISELFYYLQFDDQLIFHQYVSEIIADDFSRIIYWDWGLLFRFQSCFPNFNCEGIFVYFFQKPASQCIGYCIRTANNDISNLIYRI